MSDGLSVGYPPPSGGSVPVGTLVMSKVSPGTGYLQCNGQILSQAAYPDLYTATGLAPSFESTFKNVHPANSGSTIFVAMAYSPSLGLYVAIVPGNDSIWVSTDAVNWTSRGVDGANFFIQNGNVTDIAWCSGAAKFVCCATSTGSQVYTSSDGYHWTMANVWADAVVSYVAASSTTFVVVGASDTDNSIQYVWSSTDAVTWTRRAIAVTGKTITAIHWSSGLSMFILGCSDGSIQTSPDGITWTSRTSNIASQINQIDSYGSLAVAVGNSGVISSSPTGVTWTSRTAQTSHNLNGVAYSPTATIPWIAVGGSIRMTSTDGTTWLTIADTMPGKGDILYGNSVYVKTGTTRFLATSADLVSWTAKTPATTGLLSNAMNAGAYGNSAYVLVGAAGKIDSSADAITWTNRTANAGSNALNHVVYAAGTVNLFIAVGAGNIINTSPDGTTWTARTSNIVSTIVAAAFNPTGNVAVAVGSAGKISSSADGLTWASRTSNTGQSLNGVAWNGTIFCAAGNAGTVVTSPDGTTWTKQQPSKFGSNNVTWITSDGTNFYAITDGNTVFVSTDGITWTGYGSPTTLLSLNWVNSQLVGYSANGDIATSSNGYDWTIVGASQGVITYNKAYWVSPSFLVASNLIQKSTDGIVFQHPYFGFSGIQFLSVAYSASQDLIVAVGSKGIIVTSADGGVTWTTRYPYVSSLGCTFTSITYSPSLDLFCAVASCPDTSGGPVSGLVATSPNGVTWTTRAATAAVFGSTAMGGGSNCMLGEVAWSAALSLFIAVGAYGIILTSPDGITWTERTSGTSQVLRHIACNNSLSMIVVSGSGGTLLRSTNGITWTSTPLGETNGSTGNNTGVVSIEAQGFLYFDSTISSVLRSTDGVTWKLPTPESLVRSTFNNTVVYNPVDESVFGGSNNGTLLYGTVSEFLSNMPHWYVTVSLLYQGNSVLGVAYCPARDIWVGVGTGGAVWIAPRGYNKSTQFVLPSNPSMWTKAL